MGTEVKSYLQEHSIPQLFEGLMSGLIYNRPDEPLRFLEAALSQIRSTSDREYRWDMFIDKRKVAIQFGDISSKIPDSAHSSCLEDQERGWSGNKMVRTHRSPSVMKAAEVAQIPHVPVILFIGGPGGGKTRHAARIANTFADQGLAHICMPDVIRNALLKYKERYSEWKAANDCYLRGELIPNHLALALVKAEMGRHPQASAFLLEGFPREARQVEDFEKQVKSVNMALILDYDEKTLRDHMEKRGVNLEIIDQRIKEFKQKTLPSAKYFDDHHLLHLIPGEKDDQTIYERTKDLVQKAMSSGVPILNNSPVNQPQFHACDAVTREDNRVAATKSSGEEEIRTSQKRSCSNRVQLDSRTEIEPNTDTMTDSLRSNFPVEESVLVTKSPYDSAEPFNATISEPAPKFPKSEADARRTSLDAANVSIKSVPVVLIIGAPGASRAEIAKRIVQKFYGFILLSMGDLLRSNIAAQVGDKLWRSVARQVERGEQVPLKLCHGLLYNELHRVGQSSLGYVIEGYPRNEDQLKDLQFLLGRIDLAILIDCTERYCMETIANRHEMSNSERHDDDLAVFKRKMALFKQYTLPMLKLLDEQGSLKVVEGDSDLDTVFKDASYVVSQILFQVL